MRITESLSGQRKSTRLLTPRSPQNYPIFFINYSPYARLVTWITKNRACVNYYEAFALIGV